MAFVTLDTIKQICIRFNYYQQYVRWGLNETFLIERFPIDTLSVAVVAQYDGNHWWVVENSLTHATLLISHHGKELAEEMLQCIKDPQLLFY